jgi:hypothetical protein
MSPERDTLKGSYADTTVEKNVNQEARNG